MTDILYHGVWRMDWGLGNPNKTAALIAMLMIAVWGLVYLWRWGFWIALIIFTGLGICLIHTFSRGGMVALLAGLVVPVWKLPRPWPRIRLVAVIVSIGIMAGTMFYLGAGQRFSQGIIEEDLSISHRLQIWKSAPAMMVDAPTGWGLGNSGKAYTNWYQPLNESENYRTLVNSHLTWLVEFGWPLRFLYIFVWTVIFLLCWPTKKTARLAIPFGVWIAFVVASSFSSVAETPWLWIIPTACFLIAIGCRVSGKVSLSRIAFYLPFGAATVMCLALRLLGIGHSNFTASPTSIIWGRGQPSIWLLADEKALGHNYGKVLRRYFAEHGLQSPSLGIVYSLADLPDIKGKTLVVAGKPSDSELKLLAPLASDATKLVLISPGFDPQELSLSPDCLGKTEVVVGEFSQSKTIREWESVAHVLHLSGQAEYITSWPTVIFDSINSTTVTAPQK